MANENNIKSELACQNIAPIENLTKELNTSSLKIGVFANNGSGKTFLSRLFRLTENQEELVIDENGVCTTDKLLTIGKNSDKFSFKIIDKGGSIVEDFQISLKRGKVPTIPKTQYIYHTFNQDYVEQNIEELGYEKSGDIKGYILGKTNIDLKEDEDKLKKIENEGKDLSLQVTKGINSYIEDNISKIRDIRRISEYNDLNAENIIGNSVTRKFKVSKNIDELLGDYNKIKSVPENLPDISEVNKVNIELQRLSDIKGDLNKEFTLSSLADDFKQKVKNKQYFIEEGIKLLSTTESDTCPFCEQHLDSHAIDLIDKYNRYISDTESKTIKLFNDHSIFLKNCIASLEAIEHSNLRQINLFNEYKTKYIPSCEDIELEPFIIKKAQDAIGTLINFIEAKLIDISKPISIDQTVVDNIVNHLNLLNDKIVSNNNQVKVINKKKNSLSIENLSLRRDICKSAYNHLAKTYESDIEKINQLRIDWNEINKEIGKKREKQKVDKKKKVASTIKKVLDYFFSGKYTLNEETFSLVFHENALEKGQTKNVLSQGERNIVAFAYYVGDTYLKVNNEDDFKKLFFVIDDPYSIPHSLY